MKHYKKEGDNVARCCHLPFMHFTEMMKLLMHEIDKAHDNRHSE